MKKSNQQLFFSNAFKKMSLKEKEIENIDISTIKKLIYDGSEKFNIVDQKVVLVLGDTGAGKSTLINYLVGKKLHVLKRPFRKSVIIDVLDNHSCKIGHGFSSETLLPSTVVDSDSGLVYVDCPGFSDTRGEVLDIVNAYYMQKLFFSSTEFKIIFVAEESSFTGATRGKSFKDFLLRIENLFPDLEYCLPSIQLVITKAHSLEIEPKIFLSEMFKESCNPIITALLEKSTICSFSLPVKEGFLDNYERITILEKLMAMPYCTSPKTNISISQEAMLLMANLVDHYNKQIIDIIEQVARNFSESAKSLSLQNLDINKLADNYLASTCVTVKSSMSIVVKLIDDFNIFESIFKDTNLQVTILRDTFVLFLEHDVINYIADRQLKENTAALSKQKAELEAYRLQKERELQQNKQAEQQRFNLMEQQLRAAQNSLVSTYTAQISSLQSQNSGLQAQYNSLKTQYSALQSQYSSLQTQLSTLQSQYSNLQNQSSSHLRQQQFSGGGGRYLDVSLEELGRPIEEILRNRGMSYGRPYPF
jgi:hypothetical protein